MTKRFLALLTLLLSPLAFSQPAWENAAPIENSVVFGNLYLIDNVPLSIGSDLDFNLSFDTGNTALEILDSGGNLLLNLTDNGTKGVLGATGELNTGIDISSKGIIRAYGDGSSSGGVLLLYNAAGEDTTIDNFTWEANGTELRLNSDVGNDEFIIEVSGTNAILNTGANTNQLILYSAGTLGLGANITAGSNTLTFDTSASIVESAADANFTFKSAGAMLFVTDTDNDGTHFFIWEQHDGTNLMTLAEATGDFTLDVGDATFAGDVDVDGTATLGSGDNQTPLLLRRAAIAEDAFVDLTVQSRNDAAAYHAMFRIRSRFVDWTAGTEDTQVIFETYEGGSAANALILDTGTATFAGDVDMGSTGGGDHAFTMHSASADDMFIRFEDSNASNGGYIQYDGGANVMRLGTRVSTVDTPTIEISRSSKEAKFLTDTTFEGNVDIYPSSGHGLGIWDATDTHEVVSLTTTSASGTITVSTGATDTITLSGSTGVVAAKGLSFGAAVAHTIDSSGDITPAGASYIVLTAFGGSPGTDTLDTIDAPTGGAGTILVLTCVHDDDVITIQHTTIETPGTSVVLDDTDDKLVLINTGSGIWDTLSFSDNG